MSSSTLTKAQKPAALPPVVQRSDSLRRRAAFAPIKISVIQAARYDRDARAASSDMNPGHSLARISILSPPRVPIQPKLRVGQPDDIYEQEADRVAEHVMRMPEPIIQRKAPYSAGASSCEEGEKTIQTKPLPITPLVQRQTDELPEEEEKKKEEEETTVQTKEAVGQTPGFSHNLETQLSALRGGGQPLPPSLRVFFEPRFGHDFSKVRVHNDAEAGESARAVNALAYTVGRDIVFGAGQYVPGTSSGQRLLAHELTHVVQQAQDMPAPSLQRQDGGEEKDTDKPEEAARQAEKTSPGSAGQEISPPHIQSVRLLPLPQTPDLRVAGIGLTGPTMYLKGPSGQLYDLSPYTGNRALDLPLAALEALGIPILSYFHFHYGRAASLRGMRFRNVSALSGGTSFVRNAAFYGYIKAENVDLYGAPSSYSSHYDLLPNVGIRANPMDIGAMIHVDYFNNPLPDRPNVPTIMFSLVAPFDQNPLEALSNLGGAVYHMMSGRLYTMPGMTHNYPEFWNLPEERIR